MDVVNVHEAKTNLSKLLEKAARGESFVIAKAGKPMVIVTALEAPLGAARRRLGFLTNQGSIPDDFDHMGSSEIEELFGVSE